MKEPEQGKGFIVPLILSIDDLNISALEKMGVLDVKILPARLSFRFSFLSSTFEFDDCPTIYSEEVEAIIDRSKKTDFITWDET